MKRAFRNIPLLGKFRTKDGIRGIKIKLDSVVGLKFTVNAVHSAGDKKGELFYVDPKDFVHCKRPTSRISHRGSP
jgi:hypothetical protein